jgi:hypothetical protein
MTDAPDKERVKTGGFYVGWDELHTMVSPQLGRDRFRALIKRKQEVAGFPPFREEWCGFYRPAVKAWLDSDNRVGADKVTADVGHEQEDGPENFDAAPGRRTRTKARPSPAPVLVCEAGHAGPNGVSRHLHSVGSGRER